jgi:hypothetical protein
VLGSGVSGDSGADIVTIRCCQHWHQSAGIAVAQYFTAVHMTCICEPAHAHLPAKSKMLLYHTDEESMWHITNQLTCLPAPPRMLFQQLQVKRLKPAAVATTDPCRCLQVELKRLITHLPTNTTDVLFKNPLLTVANCVISNEG